MKHVGIIPDGNRRWARLHRVSLESAYMRGLSVLEKIALRLFEYPIHSLTVYALSYENCLARSIEEREILEMVIEKGIERAKSLAEREAITIRFYGETRLLSKKLRSKIEEVSELSPTSAFILNIGICYKPGAEEKASSPIQPLDLVIRTGGYFRLSGFFPNLSAYAELYVSEKLWPDYTIGDLEEAIAWFVRQKRSFGR